MNRILSFVVTLLLMSPSLVFAENTPTVENIDVPMIQVATVNVYEARITKQEKDFFEVAYDAHNREGIQTDIFSSLALIDSKGYIIPLYRSKQSFALGNDQQLSRVEKIAIPSYLKGDYNVIMSFATSSGLTLANTSLGKITFSGTGEYIGIEGCSLSVSGDDKGYNAMQGIDVGNDENITVTCFLRNLSSQAITATPCDCC